MNDIPADDYTPIPDPALAIRLAELGVHSIEAVCCYSHYSRWIENLIIRDAHGNIITEPEESDKPDLLADAIHTWRFHTLVLNTPPVTCRHSPVGPTRLPLVCARKHILQTFTSRTIHSIPRATQP